MLRRLPPLAAGDDNDPFRLGELTAHTASVDRWSTTEHPLGNDSRFLRRPLFDPANEVGITQYLRGGNVSHYTITDLL